MPTTGLHRASPDGRRTAAAVYIEYGPPDEIESHPSGGTYERPYEEGSGSTSTLYPFEQWRYRYIDRYAADSTSFVEFVGDMSGEIPADDGSRSEKDALLLCSGRRADDEAEQMGPFR